MDVDALQWQTDPLPQLRRPVFVMGLQGYFDVGGAATDVIDDAVAHAPTELLARIDPDPFYDFQQHRPHVYLDDVGDRHVRWPANDLVAWRSPGKHDLVMMSGIEPDVRWRTFVGLLVDAVEELDCEMAVTLGAFAEGIPHSRTPQVTGSTADDHLARSLGLSKPQYQGMTGVIGVLHQRLEQAGIPTISLRVGVPHYLLNARHPRATLALSDHLRHVLGVPIPGPDMGEQIAKWRQLHDQAVASDPQISRYVEGLEYQYDRRMESAVPSADALVEELEQFLDERRRNSDDD